MPLDLFAQRVLDLIRESGRPPYETLQPNAARALYRAARFVLQPDPAEVAEVRDLSAPGLAGPVNLRLYRARGTRADDVLPALVFFHGGGWVLGDLDSHDRVCRTVANAAGSAVIAVEYRLAPEDKFPAAVEDSIGATEWIAANAASLGIDATRLAVGGDSAGGTLAAVVAIAARDRGGPALHLQVLVYPATDLALDLDSHRRFTSDLPLTHATMVWFRDLYLRTEADRTDWRASPLRAADHRNLPPAFVVTAGFDPLRDEGDAYARRLAEGGAVVAHHCCESQIHGFLTMGRIIPEAHTLVAQIGAALRQAFAV
jgi:acetyl esterase